MIDGLWRFVTRSSVETGKVDECEPAETADGDGDVVVSISPKGEPRAALGPREEAPKHSKGSIQIDTQFCRLDSASGSERLCAFAFTWNPFDTSRLGLRLMEAFGCACCRRLHSTRLGS